MVLLFRAWCAVSVVASVSAKKKKKAATRTAFKDKHDPSRQAEDPNAAEENEYTRTCSECFKMAQHASRALKFNLEHGQEPTRDGWLGVLRAGCGYEESNLCNRVLLPAYGGRVADELAEIYEAADGDHRDSATDFPALSDALCGGDSITGACPPNAGLVVVEPRKEDFRHLVAVVREGNFTDATGWRGEGGCASAGGCNARHVTQGLWDWFYRTSRPGGLRLPRDVYNGLQDEPADGADPCLVHFTACGKPSTGACGKNPAVPMATGKKKPSDRYVGLCERSHGEWRAREAAYCRAYGPPVIKVPKAAPGDKIADARAKIAPGKVPSTKGAGKKFGGGAKKAAPAAPAPCGRPRTIHEPPRFGHAVLLAQVLLCVVVACLAFRAGVVFASPPGPPGSPPASPRRYGPPRSGTLPRSSSRRSARARS